jgi:hypothetical protein
MTFRFPSVVNDRAWKSIGRLPRVPACEVKNYDPLELTRKLAAFSLSDDAKNAKVVGKEVSEEPLPVPPPRTTAA